MKLYIDCKFGTVVTQANGIYEMEFFTFIAVFITGFAVGVYRRTYSAENKGERLVRKLLTNTFGSEQYHLLNNVTLPTESGTTQVDHILVSTKGIFVIETKHYSGWIFASEKSKTWTQVIYKSKKQFQNPIRQNYAHVMAVRSLLDFLEPVLVKSVVVFTGDAQFKTSFPEGVYKLSQLPEYLWSFQDDVLSQNRVQFCVGRIECYRYSLSRETDLEHVKNLSRID